MWGEEREVVHINRIEMRYDSTYKNDIPNLNLFI